MHCHALRTCAVHYITSLRYAIATCCNASVRTAFHCQVMLCIHLPCIVSNCLASPCCTLPCSVLLRLAWSCTAVFHPFLFSRVTDHELCLIIHTSWHAHLHVKTIVGSGRAPRCCTPPITQFLCFSGSIWFPLDFIVAPLCSEQV